MDSAALKKLVYDIVDQHKGSEGPLLPILHAIQDELDYIPADVTRILAERLNLSRADIHGVISFYHDFRGSRPGKHVLKICRAEACQSMHGRELASFAQQKLGIDWHETTDDGSVTLEPVFCLGLCANAPAAMLDNQLYAELDQSGLTQILDEVQV